MRQIIISGMLVLLISGAAWSQSKQVRDASGRLVETWSQHGHTTQVRDKSGSLMNTRTRTGNTIYVRDRNGRLLRTEKVSK